MRFDSSFWPIHETLLDSSTSTKDSEEVKFRSCVDTLFKAAVVTVFEALRHPKEWETLTIEQGVLEKYRKSKQDKAMLLAQGSRYKEILEDYKKLWVSFLVCSLDSFIYSN